MTDERKAIQDLYPDESAICYGCGRLNAHGLHIRTFWDGEYGTGTFLPQPYHTAYPGYVYGGLLASLVDCHCTGTAAAAMYDAEGREQGSEPFIQCVTGKLSVSYHKPTPLDTRLHLRSWVTQLKGRKAVIACELSANDVVCVTGELIAVRVTPEDLNKS